MGNGAFEVIFVVGTVIAARTTAISTGIDSQRAFVINLETAAVHVLVVAHELLVDFHLGNHAVDIPTGTGNHPAVGSTGITCQRKVVGGLAFQGVVTPQQFVYQTMVHGLVARLVQPGITLELISQIFIFIITGSQKHRRRHSKQCGTVLRIIIARRHQHSVGTPAVDNVVEYEPRRRAVNATGSHLIQNPQRKEVAGKADMYIIRALVIVLPFVEIVACRNIITIEHGNDMIVHIGIFIINGNACRQHIAHNHPLRRMPRYGLVIAWRITAFHTLCQTDKFFDISLFLGTLHLVVAPVIHHSTRYQHGSAGPRQVGTSAERGTLQRIEHGCNGTACQTFVTFQQIVKGLQLHPRCNAAHLVIIAETAVCNGSFFRRSAVFA